MKKCINLASSTFNLYVLYIKLAQNTKQLRRLVLENFITVIHFLFGRKGVLWALLNLSSWCLVMVEWLFLAVPLGCLQFVIVVFPDHTHYFLGPGFLGW